MFTSGFKATCTYYSSNIPLHLQAEKEEATNVDWGIQLSRWNLDKLSQQSLSKPGKREEA
jgi:hypothetical protein